MHGKFRSSGRTIVEMQYFQPGISADITTLSCKTVRL